MTVGFVFTNPIFISIFSFQPMKKNFKMLKKNFLPLVFLPVVWSCSQKSSLEASVSGRDQPIYATYAAAMDRSQYLIDQGYEFQFYEKDHPMMFFSQKGGGIGLAFKVDGEIISEIDDYFRQPSITESFPGMVSFLFQPVQGLEAKGEFFVFSSTIAAQQYEFVNTGDADKHQ
jgi:hypothetical protein